jgi:hypothetical protein
VRCAHTDRPVVGHAQSLLSLVRLSCKGPVITRRGWRAEMEPGMKHLASMTLKAVAAASTLLALPEANRVAWAMEVENNDRPPRQGMSAGPPGLMLRARTANPSTTISLSERPARGAGPRVESGQSLRRRRRWASSLREKSETGEQRPRSPPAARSARVRYPGSAHASAPNVSDGIDDRNPSMTIEQIR